MASISVTNTFTNGTTADASQVNQNFTDIINGTADGTKDFSIAALTCAGTFTANGNVNLGNASGDDLTITASLASSLPVKTNTTYSIGSATLGLQYVYLGGTSTFTARIGAATLTASRNYTVPEVSTDASFVMTAGAQIISGLKTFSDGLELDDDSGQSTFNYYREDNQPSTFTWNGSGGTSGSQTMQITRIGRMVFVEIPNFTATTGTSSSLLSNNTALPTWARPALNHEIPIHIVDGSTQSIGAVNITTAGSVIIHKPDNANFTNSTACGTDGAQSVSFRI